MPDAVLSSLTPPNNPWGGTFHSPHRAEQCGRKGERNLASRLSPLLRTPARRVFRLPQGRGSRCEGPEAPHLWMGRRRAAAAASRSAKRRKGVSVLCQGPGGALKVPQPWGGYLSSPKPWAPVCKTYLPPRVGVKLKEKNSSKRLSGCLARQDGLSLVSFSRWV